jgi:hypothetical protein
MDLFHRFFYLELCPAVRYIFCFSISLQDKYREHYKKSKRIPLPSGLSVVVSCITQQALHTIKAGKCFTIAGLLKQKPSNFIDNFSIFFQKRG